MNKQPSLFPQLDSKPKEAPALAGASSLSAVPCAYVRVVVDIPSRALSEPFTYGVPEELGETALVGATALVPFGS
ncbi:hypothetical protein, partial [Collinsella bouchesdurhonensis]|uniref:primosomal protein N' family DNA-binding protein n=1 Tax=Collinsella bouchesdurhonensis TaxID=1907654 RepID=UPI0034A1B0A7